MTTSPPLPLSQPLSTPSAKHAEMIQISRACFQFIGVPILNDDGWRIIRFVVFNLLVGLPIVNGIIAAALAFPAGELRIFGTCAYVIFPNLMVQVKLMICVAKWRGMNDIMAWVRNSFEERFEDARIDAIWQELAAQCSRKVVLYTRGLYGLFGTAITFTFTLNIILNYGTPPIADCLYIFSDSAHPQFYIANFLYQLHIFIVVGVASVAIEGPFILLTLYIEARYTFLRRLVRLLDTDEDTMVAARFGQRRAAGGGRSSTSDRMRLIGTMIDVHSDVLRAVKRISDMFTFVLLTQMVGTMGGQVFALYIMQMEFYLTMMFSASALMGQVFLYCYLGDILVPVSEPLPNLLYCSNWTKFRLDEQRHLQLMMHHVQQPVCLSIGALNWKLDLPTYVNVVRAAFSYCAVLISMSE